MPKDLVEEFKYLISLSPRSGNEAKRGVEFCHLIRNAFRIRQLVGDGSVLKKAVKTLHFVTHFRPTGNLV